MNFFTVASILFGAGLQIHEGYATCPNNVVLNDKNADAELSDNSGNKTVIRCFDTSEVTDMEEFLMSSNINADLSSWDVSSVTSMFVSYQSSQYLL